MQFFNTRKMLFIAVVAVALYCMIPGAFAGEECWVLLEAQCVECHYKTRICQSLGKKSKRKWKRSIKNMVKRGAKLSKKEQQILVECLHAEPPGSKKVCE
ncbi:hypothetical protein ACFL6N_03675 [Thermodesulfobacteriota bacterium]